MKRTFFIAVIAVIAMLALTSCAHVPKRTDPTINKPKPYKKSLVVEPKPEKKKATIELLFPVRGAHISSGFGWRGNHYHKGVDLAASIGTPIRACMNGKVISAGRVRFLNGYGNAILIQHGDRVYTYYAHLKVVKVKKGHMINRGEVIGTVGNTGKTNGPHLHLELIIKGHNHNPVPYFIIENSFTTDAKLFLRSVKKSVSTGLGLKKLIGD